MKAKFWWGECWRALGKEDESQQRDHNHQNFNLTNAIKGYAAGCYESHRKITTLQTSIHMSELDFSELQMAFFPPFFCFGGFLCFGFLFWFCFFRFPVCSIPQSIHFISCEWLAEDSVLSVLEAWHPVDFSIISTGFWCTPQEWFQYLMTAKQLEMRIILKGRARKNRLSHMCLHVTWPTWGLQDGTKDETDLDPVTPKSSGESHSRNRLSDLHFWV